MKIATWNVNSVRTRLTQVVEWLQKTEVDVLCLQETKVVDESFPIAEFRAIGYHPAVFGQKSYNGVALLSREPLSTVQKGFAAVLGEAVGDLDEQKRVISTHYGGICIVNLYVPNGSAVGSEKYAYKLRWLETLRQYLKALLAQTDRLLVCGDFNVALEEIDIHDPKGRENQVMATELERQALRHAVLDLGLADGFRKFHPEPGQFSWWDYRTAAFRRNLGWRIDHIYLTPSLYAAAIDCTIDVEPRKQPQPSDHAPVVIEF
jgi:exodeoxyribonuclease-3